MTMISTGWRRLLPLLALLLAILAPLPGQTQTADDKSPVTQLDAITSDLSQIEKILGNTSLSDEALQQQRDRLAPLTDRLRQLLELQLPRVEQARARLDQLGAKPDAKAPPETADVQREREAREKAFGEVDQVVKVARAALVQADQLQAGISDRRRELFAEQLFQQGPSLLNPELWANASAALPNDVASSARVFVNWIGGVAGELASPRGLLPGLALLGAILLYLARARYLPRFTRRLSIKKDDDSLHCLAIAFANLLARAGPPAIASWLIYSALKTAGLLPGRIQAVIWMVVIGLAMFALVQALIDAVFAPDNPERRLVKVMDSTARTVAWIAAALVLIIVVGKVLEASLQAAAASLAVSIVMRGLFAIGAAIALVVGLYRLRDNEGIEEEACLGPYVPVDGASLAPVRVLGWLIAGAVILATLAGYAVFSTFLLEQTVWISILVCVYLLLHQLIDVGITQILTGSGRFALTLKAGIGLRSGALQKIAVVLTGIAKLLLLAITLMLALAPWGVESADFVSSVRAAFFGYQIGGVTISLSAIAIAAAFFAAGLMATRAIQNWLTGKFLPTTQLDQGLRNSIVTASGYLGYTVAIALAVSSLGLSLERLTIVAGALSVGVGFGLQSVVSNFVSGLILLWERPIRVGDQVVVGDAEGIVKRINVRSTEIDTFDRSTVIVPNSNLISGVVRNRVRSDRTGRVMISISVPRSIDPGDIRTMLTDAAASHGDVSNKPPPSVLFKKIGTTTMDFDLVCVVADVDVVGRVTSDLNFVIHKRLKELEPAAAVPQLMVRGLEGLEQSLDDIAGAVAQERGPKRTRRNPPPASAGAPVAEEETTEDADKPPVSTPTAPATGKNDDKE